MKKSNAISVGLVTFGILCAVLACQRQDDGPLTHESKAEEQRQIAEAVEATVSAIRTPRAGIKTEIGSATSTALAVTSIQASEAQSSPFTISAPTVTPTGIPTRIPTATPTPTPAPLFSRQEVIAGSRQWIDSQTFLSQFVRSEYADELSGGGEDIETALIERASDYIDFLRGQYNPRWQAVWQPDMNGWDITLCNVYFRRDYETEMDRLLEMAPELANTEGTWQYPLHYLTPVVTPTPLSSFSSSRDLHTWSELDDVERGGRMLRVYDQIKSTFHKSDDYFYSEPLGNREWIIDNAQDYGVSFYVLEQALWEFTVKSEASRLAETISVLGIERYVGSMVSLEIEFFEGMELFSFAKKHHIPSARGSVIRNITPEIRGVLESRLDSLSPCSERNHTMLIAQEKFGVSKDVNLLP